MADRKVINKYYPPDFDPSKISKIPKHLQKERSASASLQTVRLMAPFSMRCVKCGEYIAQSKKFNARKQGTDESYLGVKIIRFFIKCPRCSSEIKFKTNPATGGYDTESGAVRNYERSSTIEDGSHKINEETMDERLDRIEREEKEEEERQKKSGLALPDSNQKNEGEDKMESVAKQVEATKREIEINEELEYLYLKNKALDSQSDKILLKTRTESDAPAKPTEEELQDEEIAKQIFQKRRVLNTNSSSTKPTATKVTVGTATSSNNAFRVVKKGAKKRMNGIKLKN